MENDGYIFGYNEIKKYLIKENYINIDIFKENDVFV